MVQLSHSHIITGKTTTLTIKDFVSNMMSLLFNTLSRFAIIFLLRRKCFLISWLQSPPALISESLKKKSVTASMFTPSICHKVMGPDDTIIVCLLVFFFFLIFNYKPTFSLSFCTLIKMSFVPLHFLPLE